jgi:hypothetical protein
MRYSRFLIAPLFGLMAMNAQAQGFNPYLAWLHGYTITLNGNQPIQLQPIGSYFYTHYWPSWNPPVFPTYYVSQGLSDCGSQVEATLASSSYPGGAYITVGYSTGGLVARKVAQQRGPFVSNPVPFMWGSVSIDAPHLGTPIGSGSGTTSNIYTWLTTDWPDYKASVDAMDPGGLDEFEPLAILAPGVTIYGPSAFTNAETVAGFVTSSLAGYIDPNSSTIQNLNSDAQVTIESSLPNGRSLVWSQVSYPRLPALASDIVTAQAHYATKLNNAIGMATQDKCEADYYFGQAVTLDPCPSCLQMANAYLASYQLRLNEKWGYINANDRWESTMVGGAPSDAFITVKSQQGWPGVPSGRMWQAEGSTSGGGRLGESNHGRVITGDANAAIHHALHDVGMPN